MVCNLQDIVLFEHYLKFFSALPICQYPITFISSVMCNLPKTGFRLNVKIIFIGANGM